MLVFAKGSEPVLQTGCLAVLYPAGTAEADGQLPATIRSYGSGLSGRDTFLETEELATAPCTFIDIDPTVFSSFAPSLNDLKWCAHARQMLEEAEDPVNEVSVVIANRLPQEGTTNVAYLVSLEGLGDQLPLDDGTYLTAPKWSAIRLVALHTWSFHNANPPNSFVSSALPSIPPASTDRGPRFFLAPGMAQPARLRANWMGPYASDDVYAFEADHTPASTPICGGVF